MLNAVKHYLFVSHSWYWCFKCLPCVCPEWRVQCYRGSLFWITLLSVSVSLIIRGIITQQFDLSESMLTFWTPGEQITDSWRVRFMTLKISHPFRAIFHHVLYAAYHGAEVSFSKTCDWWWLLQDTCWRRAFFFWCSEADTGRWAFLSFRFFAVVTTVAAFEKKKHHQPVKAHLTSLHPAIPTIIII